MANLGQIVYLTEAQKDELFTQGSVTSNGITITYNENDLYITPDTTDTKLSTKADKVLNATSGNIATLDANGNLEDSGYAIDSSVFYGLSEAAGVDLSNESNITVGTYPTNSQQAIQSMLGVYDWVATPETNYTASKAYAIGDCFIMDNKLYKATAAIASGGTITVGTNCAQVKIGEDFPRDVQIDGTSILSQGVANIPLANANNAGVVRISASGGLAWDTNGYYLRTTKATSAQIKEGINEYRPIAPSNQHTAVFYGLAKAAGDSTQASSDNAVGTYTDDAKVAIQKMLGVYREWELIAEVTVSEDTAQFNVTTDTNGQPFALSQMFVRAWLAPATTGTNNYVSAHNIVVTKDGDIGTTLAPTQRYLTNGVATFFEYKTELISGITYSTGTASSLPNSTTSIYKISYQSDNLAYISGFRLSQYNIDMTLIPAGSVIKIYGIRI